jgi:hypothetical protein
MIEEAVNANRSPSQILAHDRDRKALYRDALRQQGWRQRTLWTTDEGWKVILTAAQQAGDGMVRGVKRVGVCATTAHAEVESVVDGAGLTPAHLSDKIRYETQP